METLKPIILEMWNLRNNIPQLVFFSWIDSDSTQMLRKVLMDEDKIISSSSSDTENPTETTPPEIHKNEIDFILNSPGWDPDGAYRIIKMLHTKYDTVNIIIPFWAKSAATLLALWGNAIIMDELGEFWPLDMQIWRMKEDWTVWRESALNDEFSLKRIEVLSQNQFVAIFNNLFRYNKIWINKTELSRQIMWYLADFYNPLLEKIDPYKLGDNKRKLDIATQYARRIITMYNPQASQDRSEALIDYLVNYCPDHWFNIDYETIKDLIDNVKLWKDVSLDYGKKLSELSFELMRRDVNHIWYIK